MICGPAIITNAKGKVAAKLMAGVSFRAGS